MRRRAGELFGLVAYLSLMYGRLPDRDLLRAAFIGGVDGETEPEEPRLRLVVSNDSPQPADDVAYEAAEFAA